MDPILASILTLAVLIALKVLYLLATGGFTRLGLAWTAFNRIRQDAAFAGKVQDILTPPPPPPPPKPSGEALRILAVLQRESRLMDILMDAGLPGASDDQIAAAMRDLQPKAQSTLKKYLTLDSVLPQTEGDTVEVPAGFDPSAIQLIGNVTGNPPFKGTLRHGGWRVKEIRLQKPPEGQDPMVLAPAEVELP
jgi:Domain of unknown function (DUF2760)